MKTNIILALIIAMLCITGCGTSTTAVPIIVPSPTIASTSTSVPAPSQAPTLTVEQRFRESVRHWRVAYYDISLDQLCAMNADGSGKVCLDLDQYPDTYLYGAPASSPDGTYSAYFGGASWSPDGSRLVFDMDLYGLYIWEPGSVLTTFRDGREGGLYLSPQWAPHGNYIVYRSNELGRASEYGGIVLDTFIDSLDRTFHRKLPEDVSNLHWSPDGQRIAFSQGGDIYVESPTGDNPYNLTQSTANDMLPVWSPEGQSIAFLSDREGQIALYVMDAEGANVQQVTDLTVHTPSSMKWSPDGQSISFISDADGSFDLYIANVDGSGTRKVADLDLIFEHLVDAENLYRYDHLWLPDSRSILSFKTTYRLQTTGREYTYEALWIDLIRGETGILDLSFDAASAEWFTPDSK
jgi:Tol biopolymer transport system component